MEDQKKLLIAAGLSVIILMLWHNFYEAPKAEKQRIIAQEQIKSAQINTADIKNENNEIVTDIKRDQALTETKRITINNNKLHGSISLKGAKFDDLTLANYKETLEENSDEVTLLSPSNTKDSYFTEFGWISNDKNISLPDTNTIWSSTGDTLSTNNPVTLTWVNNQNISFILEISLDKDYMFFVKQKIQNNSGKDISIIPYGRISRKYEQQGKAYAILHEGPVTVVNNVLEEVNYEDIKKENQIKFDTIKSWIGFSDKYWLTALIPDVNITTKFRAIYTGDYKNFNRYQIDFIGENKILPNGTNTEFENKFFAGAKEVSILDYYKDKYNITLFDRAVDLGWLYFLTKPLLFFLQFLNHISGNFGLAIILLTVIIKIALFPLAHKSYTGMAQMKNLQPKIAQLKERCGTDRMRMNQEIMSLYKQEKVNPLAGCLPLLIQIPVFFALYKVLFVTIEMRHAPFFGWIKDLSISDPTSIFNLFGLLPFTPLSFLPQLGIWPLIMGATMVIQQRFNPAPTDPVQAQVMKFLPYIFIFLFAGFPAGLLIYWTVNNLLSILQQWVITKKLANKKNV